MKKKFVTMLAAMLAFCAFLSACSFGGEPKVDFSNMEPVGGVYGVYADLDQVTKTGCRLLIAGDPHFEISNLFTLCYVSQSGEETPLEPGLDFSQVERSYISQSGVIADYDWEELYGPLSSGHYRIYFMLLEGTGSITFLREFWIQ